MTDPDYYEILDISPSATDREIKEAYRRAVRSAHPDAGGTSGMFRLVMQAYETLSNPQRRAAYDGSTRRASEYEEEFDDTSQAEEPVEEWGEEFSWDAGDGDSYEVLTPRTRFLKWIADRENLSLRVSYVGWGIAIVLFVSFSGLLLFPDIVRPAAAEDDAFTWILQQPILTVLIIGLYAFLSKPDSIGTLEATVAPHLLATLLLLLWPIAYWDIAEPPERQIYLITLPLWALYNVALFVVGVVNEAMSRKQKGAL